MIGLGIVFEVNAFLMGGIKAYMKGHAAPADAHINSHTLLMMQLGIFRYG